MVEAQPRPRTPEEGLIFWAIVGTWGFWLFGALYHVLPMLAWGLAGLSVWRWVVRTRATPVVPGVLVWVGVVLALLVALIAGHVDYELDTAVLVKSMLGWAKGWALLALLPLAGALLTVRPEILYRASAILGAQSLLLVPVCMLAGFAGLPGVFFVSPLILLGGGDSLFFEVGPYLADPGWPGFRLRFFAPWAPAAALVGCLMVVLSAFDRDKRWAAVGISAGCAMSIFSQSRLGLIATLLLAVLVPVLSRATRPAFWAMVTVIAVVGLLGWPTLVDTIESGVDAFAAARADSSRVRAALQNIALHRWLTEAPLWGHGIVERGSHLVEFMPIGSHHTWNSLLFVKGLVGCLAVAIGLGWTLAELLAKAQADRVARAGLGVGLVLLLFSFGENLEILAYLAWPALLLLGIAMRRPLRWPA